MATKEQLDFFRFLYDEEERRYGQLEARAKLYFSMIALFLATLTFKLKDVQESIEILNAPWWLVLVESILLATALVFVVMSAFIREYEGVADPEEIVNGFGSEAPSNETFFDDRIADYVVATGRNSKMNDKSARLLEIAIFFIAAAMIMLLVILSFGFFK